MSVTFFFISVLGDSSTHMCSLEEFLVLQRLDAGLAVQPVQELELADGVLAHAGLDLVHNGIVALFRQVGTPRLQPQHAEGRGCLERAVDVVVLARVFCAVEISRHAPVEV